VRATTGGRRSGQGQWGGSRWSGATTSAIVELQARGQP